MTMVLKSYTYNCGNDEGICVRDRGNVAAARPLLPVFSRADSTRQFTKACLPWYNVFRHDINAEILMSRTC